jgi:hypothetical protein
LFFFVVSLLRNITKRNEKFRNILKTNKHVGKHYKYKQEGDSRNALCALKISVCYFPEKILEMFWHYRSHQCYMWIVDIHYILSLMQSIYLFDMVSNYKTFHTKISTKHYTENQRPRITNPTGGWANSRERYATTLRKKKMTRSR